MKNIFENQLPSGQIPTLMVNTAERRQRWVDTLAITMIAVYLAQLHPLWNELWREEIERALDFIEGRAYLHEIEGFRVWHFNGFYPPDWEDTAMAIFLLVRNGRLKVNELEGLRSLLILNSASELGTGVWVRDLYSCDNAQNNVWDPTTSINILRLHYLLETGKAGKIEEFTRGQLSLEKFSKATLYYRAPIAAFFSERLMQDFPKESREAGQTFGRFVQEMRTRIDVGGLNSTAFERTLLGLRSPNDDQGLIFHHGKRHEIWYGSPVLHALAREVL